MWGTDLIIKGSSASRRTPHWCSLRVCSSLQVFKRSLFGPLAHWRFFMHHQYQSSFYNFGNFLYRFGTLCSFRLCLAICKIFFECKIFSVVCLCFGKYFTKREIFSIVCLCFGKFAKKILQFLVLHVKTYFQKILAIIATTINLTTAGHYKPNHHQPPHNQLN